MQREIINHPQGSPEWLSIRLTGGGASEASAMLSMSPYVTREALLAAKATGIAREYSEWFETHVLAKGHEIEALARPIAEALLEGEDLYPVTMRLGALIASCDGLTMDGQTAWENKQWNTADAALVERGVLPEKHIPQCQQLLHVTGARRLLFTISDGTRENTVWMWVEPDPEWVPVLVQGWAQFFEDVHVWTPPPASVAKPIGKSMDSLPALRVLVKGEVQESNIDAWADVARAVLRSINRTLNTDQDFADAEKAVKWCGDQEAALKAAKQHALSQTESIDKLFKTIDSIIEETAAIRIEQVKLVTRRKTERKTELVSETAAMWHTFTSGLNGSLSPYALPAIPTDFAGQLKNKRNFESMSSALAAELTRAKGEATKAAERIRANRALIEAAPAFSFLFNDAATLVHKDLEAVAAIVKGRIVEHEAEQKRKAEGAAEAEREKIRAQERARLEAEAAAKAKAEREAQEARDREAKAEADRVAAQAREAAALEQQADHRDPDMDGMNPTPRERVSESVHSVGLSTVEAAPAAYRPLAAAPAPRAPSPAPEVPTLNLGEIGKRWGSRMDSTFLRVELGIEPRDTVKGAVLYFESDWRRILRALASRANRLTDDCDRSALVD